MKYYSRYYMAMNKLQHTTTQMNFASKMLSIRRYRQQQNYILYDCLHIKYKNWQGIFILLAVRIVVSVSEGIDSD